MKVQVSSDSILTEFPGGGSAALLLSEITAIDIETVPTMTVEVNLVCLSCENGEFLEISDDAEGFSEFCTSISKHFFIGPPIHQRFPSKKEILPIRVYERPSN